MNIQDILTAWDGDVSIEQTELGSESLKVARLHHKYITMLVNERLLLRKYEADLKKLKLDKYEFYTQGPSVEDIKAGKSLPSRGILLKSDVPMYLEADKDIIDLSLRIGLQGEKVSLLDSILWSLKDRTKNLQTALGHLRFINGG